MRNVVFVAPFPMDATLRFARGFARLEGVRLFGVFQELPRSERGRTFDGLVAVRDALDPDQLVAAAREIEAAHGPIHRLTGVLEPLQTPLAVARTRLGIAGPSPEVAERFRDKALMKDTLRAAGLPCARHKLAHRAEEALAFAAEVGFPLVVKPPAGAGCRATFRVEREDELRELVAGLAPRPDAPVLCEEFLRGTERSFEAIVAHGEILAHSVSHYLPNPLEVVENPWIQWVCLLPRDISIAEYDDVREVAARTVKALGLEDGMAHMEWFRRADGTLAVGEIAARPPGGQLTSMTGLVHDIDIYKAWARAVVDGRLEAPWVRRHAAATVFLRGMGRGRVARIDGLDEAQRAIGKLVEEVRLPRLGAPKADGYEGDGYVILRHPDQRVLEAAVKLVLDTVRVRYA
ncbi:MAG: ATP-grasp domain-containing protein [Deltaproteobacteria bacterium]|nr:ATP-grasp domain-containing protein [Deltaproteobacteria bacterium]